jgi:hypothetical protein
MERTENHERPRWSRARTHMGNLNLTTSTTPDEPTLPHCSNGFAAIPIERKQGNEFFSLEGSRVQMRLLDFWRWSCSDLVSNATRGVLAEFIVAKALGIDCLVRNEWDAFDLTTPGGLRIEVKSAAYLQSWYQSELSKISFGISPTQNWNRETAMYSKNIERQSDIYIFCVLHHKQKDSSLDPLNLDQWEFYVVPTTMLNKKFPKQRKISLGSLLRIQPHRVLFNGLKSAIESASASSAL